MGGTPKTGVGDAVRAGQDDVVVIANVAEGSNQIKTSGLQTEGLGDLWAWESCVHGEGVSGGGEAEGMRDQDVQLGPGRVFVFNGRNLRGG